MRKSIRPFLVALLFASILISCKKTDRSHKEDTYASDAHFLNDKLKQFAIALAPALNNTTARNNIRNLAKLKFDEEYDVLLKDIFNDPAVAALVQAGKSEQLHEEIFQRSGERLYPQIYIPHLQHLEDINSAAKGDGEIPEKPLFVFYSGDPEADESADEEKYPAYAFVGDKLVYDKIVDEKYADEHEVWIFSLNETVNENAKFPVGCLSDPCGAGCLVDINSECGGGGGGTGGGGGGGPVNPPLGPDDDPTDAPMARTPFPELGHNKINFKMEYLKVVTHHESWLAGSTEVAIRAKLVCHNGRKEGGPDSVQKEYTSDQYSNYRGQLIKKIRRKDIKNQTRFKVDYNMQANWQNEVYQVDPVHFIYVIFERDSWPAALNRDDRYAPQSLVNGQQPPGSFPLYYRSGGKKQGNNWPYARYVFTNTLWLATSTTYAGSGYVSNPEMAFNTVLY